MTLTASPSSASAVDRAAFGDLEVTETWVSSVDYRVVGRLLTSAALLIGAVGVALWGLVSLKFDASVRGALGTADFLGESAAGGFSFARVLMAVQHGLPYFVVLPLFLGVATAAIPAQIGATRMAFPRLQAFVLWGYLTATAVFVASFCVVDGPPMINLFANFADSPGSNRATDVFLGSLILVTVVTLLGATNIVATVATQRRPGLRLGSIGSFSFASLITSGVLLIATPVFLAGLGLLLLDRHFGASLLTATGVDRFWSHMIFLPSRPEALLFVLPGLGAMIDVVSAKANARPVGGSLANALLGAFGMLTFTAWAADAWVLNHMVQPTSTLQSSLVAIPLGLLLLVALGTLGQNIKNLKPDAALLFVVGMELLVVLGVANIVVAAIKGVSGPGAFVWTTNQLAVMTFAAPVLGLIAAAIHFLPASAGRKAPAAASSLAGLAAIGGLAIGALALAGLSYQSDFDNAAGALSAIALVGGLLAAGGLALSALLALGSHRGPQLSADASEGDH